MFNYLAILENEILCLKTDGHFCRCKNEKKCKFCLFVKKFEDLHEKAGQRYLQNQTEEF